MLSSFINVPPKENVNIEKECYSAGPKIGDDLGEETHRGCGSRDSRLTGKRQPHSHLHSHQLPFHERNSKNMKNRPSIFYSMVMFFALILHSLMEGIGFGAALGIPLPLLVSGPGPHLIISRVNCTLPLVMQTKHNTRVLYAL